MTGRRAPWQDGAQPGQGRGEGMLGRTAVADHQARPTVAGGRAFGGTIAFQPVDGHAMLAGTGDDGTLEVRSGKFEHRLQARGDSGDVQALAAQDGGQAVPAAPVGEPGPADLPVVAARGDELGQGQLVKRGEAASSAITASSSRGGTTSQPSRRLGARLCWPSRRR